MVDSDGVGDAAGGGKDCNDRDGDNDDVDDVDDMEHCNDSDGDSNGVDDADIEDCNDNDGDSDTVVHGEDGGVDSETIMVLTMV